MSDKKRKFFSGRSVEQAVMAAASHYGIAPDELAYREIEKKHGFVRVRRNAVIAVDPDNPRKAAGGDRKPAAEEKRGTRAEGRSRDEARRAQPEERQPEEREAPSEEAERGERKGGGRESRRPRRDREERKPEPAPEPEDEAEDEDEAAPTPGWWNAPMVERDEADDVEDAEEAEPGDEVGEAGEAEEEEPRREPVRRVDPSRGLTRSRHDADEEPPRQRMGRERSRRPAPRQTESEEETRGRGRGGRGRQERRGDRRREPPQPEPPRERPAPRSERLPHVKDEELEDALHDALDLLLDFVDVEAEAELFRNDERIEVELYGPDDHILLDDDGQLLLAMEHLLPRMLRGLYGDAFPVRVDCADFHFEREERLREMARRTADEVRRRGKPRTLDELDPAERRIVHLALADDPSVETESVGSGYYKRLRVVPR